MSKEHFDAAVFMRAVAREARQCSMPNLRYVFSLRGEAFIEQAYLMLLNRESDSVGRNKFAPIAEGRIGKCYILFCLYLSPERTSLPRP
ncbi:MAG: hypothetical protein K5657_05925, partial [Desulfovibrio sp.]|nr:hypothetical protein [Desulfovibrio sp.]